MILAERESHDRCAATAYQTEQEIDGSPLFLTLGLILVSVIDGVFFHSNWQQWV